MNPTYKNPFSRIKSNNKKSLPYFWHGITLVVWAILYVSYASFLLEKNDVLPFIFAFLCSLVILGLVHEFLINKIIKMFPYWLITDVLGVFSGLFYCLVLFLSLFAVGTVAGIVAFGFKDIIGFRYSIYLLPIFTLTSTGIAFFLLTYGVWISIIKPVQASSHVNDKIKLIFDNIIIITVSLFASFTLLFALLVVSNSNMFFSTFLSSLCFSLITYSGFKDIYFENSVVKAFKSNAIPIIQIY